MIEATIRVDEVHAIPGARQLYVFCQEIERCIVGHPVEGDSLGKSPPGFRPPPNEDGEFGSALRWLQSVRPDESDRALVQQESAPMKTPLSLWVPLHES
jgi:hypothetical protein